MLIRAMVVLGLVLAAVALAIQIGSHMTVDAIATLLAVMGGLLLAIPLGIATLLWLTRERRVEDATPPTPADPVIIIEPRPAPTRYAAYLGSGPETKYIEAGRQ